MAQLPWSRIHVADTPLPPGGPPVHAAQGLGGGATRYGLLSTVGEHRAVQRSREWADVLFKENYYGASEAILHPANEKSMIDIIPVIQHNPPSLDPAALIVREKKLLRIFSREPVWHRDARPHSVGPQLTPDQRPIEINVELIHASIINGKQGQELKVAFNFSTNPMESRFPTKRWRLEYVGDDGVQYYPNATRKSRTVTVESGWDVRGQVDAKYLVGPGAVISVGFNKKATAVEELTDSEVVRGGRGWRVRFLPIPRSAGVLPSCAVGMFRQEFGVSIALSRAGTVSLPFSFKVVSSHFLLDREQRNRYGWGFRNKVFYGGFELSFLVKDKNGAYYL